MLRNRRLRPLAALIALLSVCLGVAASIRPATASRPAAAGSAAIGPNSGGAALPATGSRPNIVFVLTDDLSMDLLRFMPHVQAMQRDGLTFGNYFVSDSLCCPSRASIFTGNLPHDTGVFSNVGPRGGFHVFYKRGEELDTFAVALQSAGYRTAMMGKYLNGYLDGPGGKPGVPATYVPPGWTEWDVGGQAYPEFDYRLNENGTLRSYGHQPTDYLTDVLARKGVDFINGMARANTPFFLEIATFAPHSPYTPAPRDAADFPGLTAPRPPSFNVMPTGAPRWLADHAPLTQHQIDQINAVFRLRAQDVQSVDEMIGELEQALSDDGLASNTYIVFSSDNGLHTGEYRLMPGKMTAFDTDIHVPLIVVGPGVPAGATTAAMTENIDLAKTFAAIGATDLPSDGHSLLPLLHGDQPTDWRNAVLIEHQGPDLAGLDPDFQQTASGSPRTYEAMRTKRFVYVVYNDGEREFYDLTRNPFELHNLAGRLSLADRALLDSELAAIEQCHGGGACWDAMHLDHAISSLRRAGGQRGRPAHPHPRPPRR
ncbi:MAG TPA: sulfatase [Solirubrobacteraceae bacterium]|nr:sulfatase [Solirubrobacteraceae bacterium]